MAPAPRLMRAAGTGSTAVQPHVHHHCPRSLVFGQCPTVLPKKYFFNYQ